MWVLMIWLATIAWDDCSKPRPESIAVAYKAAGTVGQTPKEPMSRETFLATEWGFGARSISIPPPQEGFPITFREDGSIEPFNLSLITRWSLTADGILELSPDPRLGDGPIRFEWREPGVFLSCSSRAAMLIAPKTIFAREWSSAWTRCR